MSSPRWMARTTWGLVLAALLLVGPPAVAQTEEPEPTLALRDLGKKALAKKKYRKAASYFEKALQLIERQRRPDKVSLIEINWGLGRAYSQLGECRKALGHIKAVPTRLTNEQPKFKRIRAELEKHCHQKLMKESVLAFACKDTVKHAKALKARGVDTEMTLQKATLCAKRFITDTPDQRLAAKHFLRALDDFKRKEWKAAKRALTRSLKRYKSRSGNILGALIDASSKACHPTALKRLDAFGKVSDKELGRAHDEAIQACLTQFTRRSYSKRACRDVMINLRRLRPMTRSQPATSERRQFVDKAWAYCEPRDADFILTTPERRLANKQYLLGKIAVSEGRLEQGKGYLERALIIADVPVIRVRLARLLLRLEGCAEAHRMLSKIPSTQRTRSTRDRILACGAYRYSRSLNPPERAQYVALIEQAIRASRQKVTPLDIVALYDKAIAIGGHQGRVNEQVLRLLSKLEACNPFLTRLGRTPIREKRAMKWLASTRARCLPKPTADTLGGTDGTTLGGSGSATGIGLRASSKRELRKAGWIVTGVGALSLATSIGFGVAWWLVSHDASSAAKAWNRGGTDAIGTGGPDSVVALYNRANGHGTASLVTLGVGVATLTTGLILALKNRPPQPLTKKTITLVPTLSPGGVGLMGSF